MNIGDKLREIYLFETKERISERKDGKRILKRYIKSDSVLKGWNVQEIRKIVYRDYEPHPKDIDIINKIWQTIQRKKANHSKNKPPPKKRRGKLAGWLNKTGSRIYTKKFIIPSYIYVIARNKRVNFSDKQIIELLVEFLKMRFPSMKFYKLLWVQKNEVRE